MTRTTGDRSDGFALIESIAVLALSAMVLLGLLIASSLITRNSAAATRRANAVENLATGMEALRRDLAGARFARSGVEKDAPVLFVGQPQSLGFVVGYEGSDGAGSESMIWIEARNAGGASALVRSSARLLPQATSFAGAGFSNPAVLLAGPWSYRFSYAEPGDAGPGWRPNWSARATLPEAVRLEILDRSGQSALPPLIVGLHIDAEVKCVGDGCPEEEETEGQLAEESEPPPEDDGGNDTNEDQ